MRYAIIDGGKVTSIVEWDGKLADAPEGYLARSDVAEVGDKYDMESDTFPDHVVTAAELVSEPEPAHDAEADHVIDDIEHHV